MLVQNGKKNKVFTYPRSIFLRRGLVRFRFRIEEQMKSFIAETEIMLEAKCTSAYRDSFYVSASGTEATDLGQADCLALEDQHKAILSEDRYYYVHTLPWFLKFLKDTIGIDDLYLIVDRNDSYALAVIDKMPFDEMDNDVFSSTQGGRGPRLFKCPLSLINFERK